MLHRSWLPKCLYEDFFREFSCSSRARTASKSKFSLFRTSSMLEPEAYEQRLKDFGAAVPPRPSLNSVPRLYRDMVKPEDICDLFWKPTMEDYVVMCLAKECPLVGDSLYKVVSKSPIDESKLMFANIAISWLDSFKRQILPLQDISRAGDELTYNRLDPSISQHFSRELLGSANRIHAFGNSMLQKGFSFESTVQFLFSRRSRLSDFEAIMQFLLQNFEKLNPVSVKDFTAFLVNDALYKFEHKQGLGIQYVKHFHALLDSHLLKEYPDLISGLSVPALEKLTYLSSVSGNYATAQRALCVMVYQHKIAPSKPTWESFMKSYSRHATEKSLLKPQILTDLSALKPILFHHGLSPESFSFLLAKVVDNVHDLSHFVQLAQSLTPGILTENRDVVLQRLAQISSTSKEPEMIKKVRLSQLRRMLNQSQNATEKELKS